MATVLLTGANGLLGRQLAGPLAASYDLILVDVQEPLAPPSSHKTRTLGFDLRDHASIYDLFARQRIDFVVHAAAISHPGPSFALPMTTVQINFDATITLLEAARLHRVERFIFISTIGVYGKYREPRVTEDHPMVGDSPYAITKLAAELMGKTYGAEHGLPFVALRYSLIYGPDRRQPCPIRLLVEAAADGRHIRFPAGADTGLNILYQADAIAPVLACVKGRSRRQEYNIGDGGVHRLGAVVEILKSRLPNWQVDVGPGVLPREVTGLPLGEYPGAVIDISRAAEDLEFEPRFSLEAGVDAYLEHLTAQRAGSADLHSAIS